jgi:hypothetical protein
LKNEGDRRQFNVVDQKCSFHGSSYPVFGQSHALL